MELLSMLVIASIIVFYKLTTKADRRLWLWNCVAFLAVGGLVGFLYSALKAGQFTE